MSKIDEKAKEYVIQLQKQLDDIIYEGRNNDLIIDIQVTCFNSSYERLNLIRDIFSDVSRIVNYYVNR